MREAIVQVSNNASRDMFIRGDPNWDDQVLLLDGQPANSTQPLGPGQTVQVSVPAGGDGAIDEYALGVIFADGKDFDYGSAGAYQTTIGRDAQTGLLGVTDESTIKRPAIRYEALSESGSFMKMEFVDAVPDESAASRSFAF